MKRTRFRMTQDAKDALVLLSPLLVLTGVFLVFPVASNFYYSLTKWKGLGTPVFIGLENYR
ncbi:MAG: sugar ABC transporter permease, partial [Sphaerochaetaceae bacterium]